MADDIRLIIGVDDRDLIRSQKEQRKFERNLLTIEAAYRKGQITSSRYTSELNKQAKKLSLLGGTYKKANSEVRSYSATIRKLTDDHLRLTMAQNQAGKSTNRFGMYAQQVGYQVGDFFVQVQSGTSALVAFGQQGTQLAGLLPGVYGAIVGIGLSLGTMVLRSFMDASGASKTFKEALEDTESSMEAYAEYAEKAAKGTNELTESFGGFADAMKGVLKDLSELEKQDALKNFNQQIENLSVSTQSWRGMFVEALNGTTEATKLLSKELGITLSEFTALNLEQQKTKSGSLEERVSAAVALRDSILEITGGTEDMSKKMREYYNQLLLSIEAGSELTATLDGSGKEAEKKNKAEKEALKVAEKTTEEYNKQWSKLSDKIYLLEVEKQYGASAIIFLTEQSRLSQAAYQAQLEASGMAEDQVASLVSLNQEMEEFNLKLAASTLDSERLARNLATAASFNTGGLGGEFASVATGLDAFGGKGDYKYDEASSVKIEKKPKEKKVKDPVADFRKKLNLERELLGATEARQKVLKALGSDFVKNNPKQVKDMEEQINKTYELIAVEEKRQGIIDSITGSIENGMMAMIDGTMSVKDAFKSMAAEIIKELYRVLVVQQMVNAAKTAFGIPFADGGAFSGGSQIEAYANGGVVGSPTTFPMTGGKTGLMGEAGPEAIMPLKRGANGKLGVQMEGGGGDVININQSFNFQANGDDSVKKLIAQAAPKIADMAKASVIDSRRRGGSTKAAFG